MFTVHRSRITNHESPFTVHESRIIRIILLAIVVLFATTSCNKHDDEFDFVGKVIAYEECGLGYGSFGYVIQLCTPDDRGGDYTLRQTSFSNVVVAYGSDRLLHENDSISGTMYPDPNYSKTTCDYHYNRDCPEMVFTKLKVIK